MFRRTPEGLSNQALFLDADIVVFLEGSGKEGKTYSKAEAYTGECNQHAVDVGFWKVVLSVFLPNIKFKFLPIGSKVTLQSIGQDIAEGKVFNVYVAMDRDFQVDDSSLCVKGVLYTYGYSWENDVWHKNVLSDVVSTLCSTRKSPAEITTTIDQINAFYDSFLNEIKPAVCADSLLCSAGTTAFIPRNNHMRCLKIKRGHAPVIHAENIEALFETSGILKETALAYGSATIDPAKDCLGHLVADFCYQLIIYFLNNFANLPSIPKDYVTAIVIEKFHNRLESKSLAAIWNHYDKVCNIKGDRGISSRDRVKIECLHSR